MNQYQPYQKTIFYFNTFTLRTDGKKKYNKGQLLKSPVFSSEAEEVASWGS